MARRKSSPSTVRANLNPLNFLISNSFFEDQLKDKRWNWVHVQDLADAYVRAAKNSHSVAGEIFNIVSESSPTVGQLTLATARVAGFKGKLL